MIPWVHLDTAAIPGEHEPMRLRRRGDEFSITVGTIELMTSRAHASERALADLTCARLASPRPRVIIGGLGMGFTLRAALDALPPEAQVLVAELVPAVVAWARGPLAHLFAGSLDDPRVEVRQDDVGRVIQQQGASACDAILLDVDNGPDGLTRPENDRLYDSWGLRRARFALRPGGVLAVWSSGPDRKFKARLHNEGFAVDELRVPASGNKGRRHVLWLATRPAKG